MNGKTCYYPTPILSLITTCARSSVSLPLQSQQDFLESCQISRASTCPGNCLALWVLKINEVADTLPCSPRRKRGRKLAKVFRFRVSDFGGMVRQFLAQERRIKNISRTCYPECSFPSSLSSFHKSPRLHVQLCQLFDLDEVLKLHPGIWFLLVVFRASPCKIVEDTEQFLGWCYTHLMTWGSSSDIVWVKMGVEENMVGGCGWGANVPPKTGGCCGWEWC